jgi:hypothetical protein
MAFLDQALVPSATVESRHAVSLFRQFLQLRRNATVSEIVQITTRRLPVRFQRTQNAPPPGTGRITIQPEQGLFSENDEFVVELGSASRRRTEFLQIHELAHAILYSLMCHPLTSEDFRRSHELVANREQFCNQFARELLLRDDTIKHISLAFAEEVWFEGDRQAAERVWAAEGPRLTYQHIRALAGRLALSIRFVISMLHRHHMMDEAACGMSIMRFSPNRETGVLSALRVWQIACPSWGFVIPNRRVIRQGFLAADEIYNGAVSQSTEVRMETLLVRTQNKESTPFGRKRWNEMRLRTACAYTPVDVRDEGRYLVAIWSWPKGASE